MENQFCEVLHKINERLEQISSALDQTIESVKQCNIGLKDIKQKLIESGHISQDSSPNTLITEVGDPHEDLFNF